MAILNFTNISSGMTGNGLLAQYSFDSALIETELIGDFFPMKYPQSNKKVELDFITAIGSASPFRGADNTSGVNGSVFHGDTTADLFPISHTGLITKEQLTRDLISPQAMTNFVRAIVIDQIAESSLWGYGYRQGLFNLTNAESVSADFTKPISIENAVLDAIAKIDDNKKSNPDAPYIMAVPSSWKKILNTSYNQTNGQIQAKKLRQVLSESGVIIRTVPELGGKVLTHPIISQLLPQNATLAISKSNTLRIIEDLKGLYIEVNINTSLPLYAGKPNVINIVSA